MMLNCKAIWWQKTNNASKSYSIWPSLIEKQNFSAVTAVMTVKIKSSNPLEQKWPWSLHVSGQLKIYKTTNKGRGFTMTLYNTVIAAYVVNVFIDMSYPHSGKIWTETITLLSPLCSGVVRGRVPQGLSHAISFIPPCLLCIWEKT